MSPTAGAVGIAKFPVPDGRTVEISSEMSTAELLTALQQIVNVWCPLRLVDDLQVMDSAQTESLTSRLLVEVIGKASPKARGADRVAVPDTLDS